MTNSLCNRLLAAVFCLLPLTAAAQLLSQSSTSISDVAVAVGFDNFSYFCRLFRKKYQVSPKQYRQCAVCPA